MVNPLNALTSRTLDALSMDGVTSSRAEARDKSAPVARQSSRNAEGHESHSAPPAQAKVVSARIKRLMKADY
jgi:hypothetical protein